MPEFHLIAIYPTSLRSRLVAAVFACALATGVYGAELVVVGDSEQAYVQAFVAELSAARQITERYGKPLVLGMTAPEVATKIATAKAVVTVGNEAAKRYHPLVEQGVMVHALMTEGYVDRLKAAGECSVRNHAVLLIEQPVTRYLAAIKTALPGRVRLGVIYGPQSARHAKDVRQAAQAYGFVLIEDEIGQQEELTPALTRLLPQIDVLLALPDQVVVNANTARTLILDTYLRGVALVGYSQSMVKAGALLAIHSTPQQLGKQTAELVTQLATAPTNAGEKDIYPTQFEVSINYQVARVLGLDLPDEEVLRQRLVQQGTKP